jgi:serine/threonine protein kinase
MVSSLDAFHEVMESYDFTYFERDDFRVNQMIGSGYIGEVFEGLVTLLNHCVPCVIKKLTSKSYDLGKDDSYFYDDIIHEVKISHEFPDSSQHQIRYYGYSTRVKEDEISLYILMENTHALGDIQKYIYGDDFWVRLTKDEYDSSNSNTMLSHDESYWDYIMSQKDKLRLIYHIAVAIQELHSYNIVHCDIKPHNMLFVKNKVTLIDYNASVKVDDALKVTGKREQGTPGYMAKEMYKGYISYKADIYALGVTMLEVWFGDIWPHVTDRYDKNRRYVLDYLSLLEDDNPSLHQLVRQCISVAPRKRPDIRQVIHTLQTMVHKDKTMVHKNTP